MAAGLTDHVWTIRELLTTLPIPAISNTEEGDCQQSSKEIADPEMGRADYTASIAPSIRATSLGRTAGFLPTA